MNKKNILFLALVGINFNTFGMKKFGDLLFGGTKTPVVNSAGWTLVNTYNSAHRITVSPIQTDITKKLFLTHSFDSASISSRATMETKCTFPHPHSIWEASFFPTGDRIVTISDDEFLRIFALSNKEQIAQFTHNDNIRHVGFDTDGSLLVRTFQGETHVFVNNDKSREKQYIKELLIQYFAAKKSRPRINSSQRLVSTFADHFALDPEQLQIVWNSMPAKTQELMLQAIQSSSERE